MITSALPILARPRAGKPDLPWWAWPVTGIGIIVLAFVMFAFTPPSTPAAPWWPAAGLGVVLVLVAPPRQAWLAAVVIFAANLASNLLIGRPWWVSAIYALANVVEALAVFAVLGSPRRRFALRTLRDAGRFVLAAMAGATVLGVIVGVVAVVWTGEDYAPAAFAASASHIAAILLIAPFATLPHSAHDRMPLWETATQTALLAASIVIAFHPQANLPLTFLPFTFLAWGALRQPAVIAYAQALAASVILFVIGRLSPTLFGGQELSSQQTAIATVVYMSTVAIFMVLIVTARHEVQVAHRERMNVARAQLEAEREHAAALTTRLELERQRDDFVATTSHELRTPITSIAGYAELLADTGDLGERERAWVEVIERNTGRLSELVEDLLALGRATAPGPRRGAAPIDVRDLVSDVLLTHRPQADARGVALHDETTDAVVHAHSGDIRRVLINLVSNAVKFTPEDGSVTVSCERVGFVVAITVADTGPGMSADTLEHAFARFYRGADAEQQSTPGTGLGLAIAQELAERNGGTVELASPPGGGLIATLKLPASPTGRRPSRRREPNGPSAGDADPEAAT